MRIFVWLAATEILLEAILLTYSRGALLGLGLSLLVLALLAAQQGVFARLQGRGRRMVALAAAIGLLLVAQTFTGHALAALRLSSQSDQDWYRAAYASDPPARMAVCSLLHIPVTVENRSPLTWLARGPQSYHLGYHWLYTRTRVAEFEGLRTTLPADVPPGASVQVPALLRAPRAPGPYLLVWDMVQENVSWFGLKSAIYTPIPVTVTALPPAQRARACRSGPLLPSTGRPAPKALPVVLSEPDRQQLWKAALAMITARPLLGIGPDGFRLNYGHFATPRLTAWDQRILANSLYLELGADLGLIGAALFLAFLLSLVWPLIAGARTRQRLDMRQIALLAAFAALIGHGLVDYNLESHAIFILVCVLCGIAATYAPGERRLWPGGL